jgi:hypothetical protein
MIIPAIDLHMQGALAIFSRPMTPFFAIFFRDSGAPIDIAFGAAALSALMCAFWALGVAAWAMRTQKSVRHNFPSVSILVAGRNEEQCVQSCLAALIAQDYPANLLEVCFVDDHSTDSTLEIALRLSAASPGRMTILSAPACPPNMGPKKNALKFAIERTRGEILIFTDADCLVGRGWVRALVDCYDSGTGAVTGAVIPLQKPGWRNLLARLERVIVSYTSASAIGFGRPASASGGNFSYRRSVYDDLGGIAHPQVRSGDDDLMAQAISRAGWKVAFARGDQSVVAEIREPEIRAMMHSAVRHQSTTRFYPLRWRIAYALTIASGLGVFGLTVVACHWPVLFLIIAAVFVFRVVVEGLVIGLFSRRLGLGLSVSEFGIAETLLPVYMLVKPLLAFGPRFTWRDRSHVNSVMTEPGSAP